MKTITTTIKWHNAAEELPKKSCEVLIIVHNMMYHDMMYIATLSYSGKYKLFNALDCDTEEEAAEHSIKVDYWCYLDEVESGILAAENGK